MSKDTKINDMLENNRIEPFSLIHDVIVNWWLILLAALAAAIFAYVGVSVTYEPDYTTSATFAITSKLESGSYSNLSTANEMASTFQKIIESSAMNKILCEELGVDSIDAEIKSNVIQDTNLLELSVTSSSPRVAYDTIHAIMDNYTKVSYFSLGNAVMEPLNKPQIPMSPSNPLNAQRVMKLAFLAAAVLLAGLFAVLSFFRDTIKQEREIELKLDASSLGELPYEPKIKTLKELLSRKKKAMLVNQPLAGFSFVESYRKFVSRIEYKMAKRDSKVLLVSSVSENEGKSTVAANIAISLAQRQKKVLIVDGDLRRPSQFLILGVQPEEGKELSEFLTDGTHSEDLVMKTHVNNLFFIGGRNSYSTSSDILKSENLQKMYKLINTCKKLVDYVIIDSPPAGTIGDAELLARCADEVLLVVRQNFILAEDINDVMDTLRNTGCHVLGVVLNRVISFENLTAQTVGRYSYSRYTQYGKDRGKANE